MVVCVFSCHKNSQKFVESHRHLCNRGLFIWKKTKGNVNFSLKETVIHNCIPVLNNDNNNNNLFLKKCIITRSQCFLRIIRKI